MGVEMGEVAAPAAGEADFFADLMIEIDQQYAFAALASRRCAKHACGAGADNDCVKYSAHGAGETRVRGEYYDLAVCNSSATTGQMTNQEYNERTTMDVTTLYWIGAIALVLIGIAGTVLPGLPGTPLVFGGLLLAAWIDDFSRVGVIPLVVLGILTVFSFAVDIIGAMLGAKRVGASKYAIIGAALGTLFGMFAGIIGLVIGPLIGAVVGELMAKRNLQNAGKVGVATWIGILIATAVKLALVFAMVGIFVTAYFF